MGVMPKWRDTGGRYPRYLLGILYVIAALGIAAPEACGNQQDSTRSSASEFRERPRVVMLPIWIPGYRGRFSVGDVQIGGGESDENGILDQIFRSKTGIDFYLVVAAAYNWHRWQIRADILRAEINQNVIFTLTNGTLVDADINPTMVDLLAGYRVFTSRKPGYPEPRFEGWCYGGLRYYHVRIKYSTVLHGSTHQISADWLDPLIGGNAAFRPHRRWTFGMSGDIGGFHIGSYLSWKWTGYGTFRTGALITLTLAWVVLDTYHETTIWSQRFSYDVLLAGPMLRIEFHF